MKVIPYISFNGNCEEAITFYHSVLGGEITIMRFSELPAEENIPISDNWKNKVMHASLTFEDGNVIYFGDTMEDSPITMGNNTTIHLVADSEESVHTIVDKLSVNGEITMAADRTFWGSVYGNLVDKFGVNWGVEFEISS